MRHETAALTEESQTMSSHLARANRLSLTATALLVVVLPAIAACSAPNESADADDVGGQAISGTSATLKAFDKDVDRCFANLNRARSAKKDANLANCLSGANDKVNATAFASFHASAKSFCAAQVAAAGPDLTDEGKPLCTPADIRVAACLTAREQDLVTLLRIHSFAAGRERLANNDDFLSEFVPATASCGAVPSAASNKCIADLLVAGEANAEVKKTVGASIDGINAACAAAQNKPRCVRDAIAQFAIGHLAPVD